MKRILTEYLSYLLVGALLGMIMAFSFTPQAYAASNDSAIIVKGNSNQTRFQHDTDLAYNELNKSRNLSAADIQYLDGNTSAPGVDGIANKSNLNQSITQWAKDHCTSGGKLTIYISGHGGNNGTPNDTTDDYLRIGPDKVTGQELKAWINQLKNSTGVNISEIVIVIESCHSGSFIDDLNATNTTVITASEPCKPSYGYDCYGNSFSEPFWKNITDNRTLTQAFTNASQAVSDVNKKFPGLTPQVPLYDDNGDGVGHPGPLPNGSDGNRTKDLKTGVNVSNNSRPVINNKTPDQTVAPGTSKLLNVTATDNKNVTRVYGRVFAPGFDFCDPSNEECVWDPPTIEFMHVGGNLWQYNYTFGTAGDYYIMLLAEDNESSLSYADWIDINAPGGVGGIVEFPQLGEPGAATPDLSGHNYGAAAGIIAGAVAGVIALTGAVWYIRRRRTKAT